MVDEYVAVYRHAMAEKARLNQDLGLPTGNPARATPAGTRRQASSTVSSARSRPQNRRRSPGQALSNVWRHAEDEGNRAGN